MNAPLVPPERSGPGVWTPLPMQRAALACGAYELFLGGAAGPGKSEYLVVAPLRWVHHPTFRAVLFRNTFPELQRTLIEKSRRLYPSTGATYNEARHAWTWPTGASVEFAYLESDRDVHRYQGAEFQFVGFDELPHFTEYAYRYMQSRLRSAAGIPIRLRATGNPDGPHLEWVRARFAEWIDGRVPMGEARWFAPDGAVVSRDTEHALSRCYVPGRLRDNPYLPPEYVAQLMALDPVTRAKLLDGDWDACVGEGKLFHRDWWDYLDAAPVCTRKVRAWDLGAGGDPSEGVLMGDRGPDVVPRYVVLDDITHVGPPHELHALIKATAVADGPGVTIRLPQDPGQAGKDQAQTYVRELAGFTVITKPVTGDKVTRAGPFSSQVGGRNVAVLRAPWTPGFVGQLHAFPDTPRDDKVDAAADAFVELAAHVAPAPARTTILRPQRSAVW
jgi:predicted phage terminase large subunit-like protein